MKPSPLIRLASKLTLLCAAALAVPCAAQAASVPVANFSFELDPIFAGPGVQVPINWLSFNDNNYSGANNTNYNSLNPLAAPANGNQYFAINEGPSDPTGGIYQDVGSLLANTTYTLTVAIGRRSDFNVGSLGSPGIITLYNGTSNAGISLASTSGIPSTLGIWQDYTVSYTTGAIVSGDLTVALSVAGASTFQANFDNVRITSISTVPEPSIYGLAIAGFLGMVLMVRRRQLAA